MNGILLNQGGAGAVTSVNGQTGEVNLTTEDLYDKFIVDGQKISYETNSGDSFLINSTEGLHYFPANDTFPSVGIHGEGFAVTSNLTNPDVDITLTQHVKDNFGGIEIVTHKLSEKADKDFLVIGGNFNITAPNVIQEILFDKSFDDILIAHYQGKNIRFRFGIGETEINTYLTTISSTEAKIIIPVYNNYNLIITLTPESSPTLILKENLNYEITNENELKFTIDGKTYTITPDEVI